MSAVETSPARWAWSRVLLVGVILGGVGLAANSIACTVMAPPGLSAGPYSEIFAEHPAWRPANLLAGAAGAVWGLVPALLGYAGMKGRRVASARAPWVAVALAYLVYVGGCASEGASVAVATACASMVLAGSAGLAVRRSGTSV